MRLNASTLSTFYYERSQLVRLLTTLDVLSDGKLMRFAESSIDEALWMPSRCSPSLDQMLDFASQVIARTGRL